MRPILLLTLDFPPRVGGVARYLANLAEFFCDEIRVVVNPEQGSEVFDSTAPYPVERRELLFRKFWPRWLKAVWFLVKDRKNYQTIIVSHVLPLGTAAWLAKFFTSKSYIVIVHGLDVGAAGVSVKKRWLTRRVLHGAKVVVTNSKALAEEVKRDFGVERTEVVYPGIKKTFGTTVDRRLYQMVSIAKSNDSFVIVTVSRLISHKGHLRVLEAVARLKDQIKGLKYQIVGDGPMFGTINQKIIELGLSNIVHIDRSVSDSELVKIYEQADLFVMPTVIDPIDREGFGTVYLEAAAHGVPSIATNQPGVNEAVINGQTGVLVPDGDINALTEAILTLSEHPEERSRLGENARKRVLAEFTAEKQLEKVRAAV